MRISISTEKGIGTLQRELEQVQKQCRARTVTAAEIVCASEKITEALHISKRR